MLIGFRCNPGDGGHPCLIRIRDLRLICPRYGLANNHLVHRRFPQDDGCSLIFGIEYNRRAGAGFLHIIAIRSPDQRPAMSLHPGGQIWNCLPWPCHDQRHKSIRPSVPVFQINEDISGILFRLIANPDLIFHCLIPLIAFQ